MIPNFLSNRHTACFPKWLHKFAFPPAMYECTVWRRGVTTRRAAARSDQCSGCPGPTRPDRAGRRDQNSTDCPRTIKSKRRGHRAPTGTIRPRRCGRAPAQAKADSGTSAQHREQIAPLQLMQRCMPLFARSLARKETGPVPEDPSEE